jgi:O-antigen ligase
VYSALLNPVNDPSTATRIVESINFFENLYERNAFLQGIGLGGRWYEFTPQPEDPGAYPLLERLAGSHLGVHVPLLRLIFDFGFIGFVIFTVLILKCYKEIRVILRSERAQPAMKAFIHASWLVIVFVVFINNLAVPKMSLLAGVLFGVLAALVEYDRKSTPRHIAWTP